MKRTERHHLKEDPLVAWVLRIRESVAGSGTATIIGAVIGVGILIGGLYAWQQSRLTQSSEMLAAAMVVVEASVAVEGDDQASTEGRYASVESKYETALPLLLEAANAYPSLQAGIVARYQAAALLVTLGRAEEAVTQFAQVAELDADGVYGRMARLGRADAMLSNGEYGQAITLLEMETAESDAGIPVDAVLMRLGMAYELSNQDAEAVATYTRVVDEFPTSLYRFDAESKIDSLSGGG